MANFMWVQFKHDLPAFHGESIEMSPLVLLALPRHRVRGVRPAWLAVLQTQRDLDVQVRQVVRCRHFRWLIRSIVEKDLPSVDALHRSAAYPRHIRNPIGRPAD